MGIDPRIEDLECVCRSYIYGDAPLAFFSRHLNRSAERAEMHLGYYVPDIWHRTD